MHLAPLTWKASSFFFACFVPDTPFSHFLTRWHVVFRFFKEIHASLLSPIVLQLFPLCPFCLSNDFSPFPFQNHPMKATPALGSRSPLSLPPFLSDLALSQIGQSPQLTHTAPTQRVDPPPPKQKLPRITHLLASDSLPPPSSFNSVPLFCPLGE